MLLSKTGMNEFLGKRNSRRYSQSCSELFTAKYVVMFDFATGIFVL